MILFYLFICLTFEDPYLIPIDKHFILYCYIFCILMLFLSNLELLLTIPTNGEQNIQYKKSDLAFRVMHLAIYLIV